MCGFRDSTLVRAAWVLEVVYDAYFVVIRLMKYN